MTHLKVADDGTHLTQNGVPFVVVADTAWSAFADIEPREWIGYLRQRRAQGFNVVMVSTLPILHDRVVWDGAHEPFAVDADGHDDFDAPDAAYVERSRWMAQAAAAEGITLGLVVLWNNYVPGTWGAERTPWAVMTDDQRTAHVARTVATFAEFDPIFIISGDDAFDKDAVCAIYGSAMEQAKRAAPWCLTTMHAAPSAVVPAALADSPHLDFYSYQAGHDIDEQSRTWRLAEQYLAYPVRRPIIDLEPCYEGHGYNAGRGRFTQEHIRRATWWSILGGASAGIGYGAHGVWQWFRREGSFTSADFSLEPFPVTAALEFRGADDAAFAAALVASERLFELTPRQSLLTGLPEEFRAAATSDLTRIAVYAPDPRDIRLSLDLSDHRVTVWDLSSRRQLPARVTCDAGESLVHQAEFFSDMLLLAERPASTA